MTTVLWICIPKAKILFYFSTCSYILEMTQCYCLITISCNWLEHMLWTCQSDLWSLARFGYVSTWMGNRFCQARGSLIYENKVNGWLQNIRKTPVFWSCTAGGSGVALPHIHLQRYYPSIANNRLSFLVFEHEVSLYRMNPVHWQNRAFRKLCFEEDNYFL